MSVTPIIIDEPAMPHFETDTTIGLGSKFILNTNPITSDENLVGADLTNQFIKLFSGWDISSEENIRINTPFKFVSSRFVMYDFDSSHMISFLTENIATGNNRTVTWRAMDYDNDYPVLEYQQQTLNNKILADNISVSDMINFNGFGIDSIDEINFRDLLNNNVPLFGVAGVPPNTTVDLLSGYNSVSYPNIVPATNISLRFGYDSDIDSYLFYSKATGTNTLLLSLTPTELDITVPIIDFNNNNVTNLVLDILKLPNQTGVEPVATTTAPILYRKDIDANNQALYITKIENGVPIKVRVS